MMRNVELLAWVDYIPQGPECKQLFSEFMLDRSLIPGSLRDPQVSVQRRRRVEKTQHLRRSAPFDPLWERRTSVPTSIES